MKLFYIQLSGAKIESVNKIIVPPLFRPLTQVMRFPFVHSVKIKVGQRPSVNTFWTKRHTDKLYTLWKRLGCCSVAESNTKTNQKQAKA